MQPCSLPGRNAGVPPAGDSAPQTASKEVPHVFVLPYPRGARRRRRPPLAGSGGHWPAHAAKSSAKSAPAKPAASGAAASHDTRVGGQEQSERSGAARRAGEVRARGRRPARCGRLRREDLRSLRGLRGPRERGAQERVDRAPETPRHRDRSAGARGPRDPDPHGRPQPARQRARPQVQPPGVRSGPDRVPGIARCSTTRFRRSAAPRRW